MDKPDYADRAVTEALVNALIHRDYIVRGSEIHIDMYDDRLEIQSPGGMFEGKLIQDCNGSVRRNPVIADLFHRMKYMERRGSGLRKIVSETEKLPGYTEALRPEFHSTATDFRVVLKNVNGNMVTGDHDSDYDSDHDGGHVRGYENRLTALIDFCKIERTRDEMMASQSIASPSYFRKHFLKPLLESGRIRMTIPEKPKSKNQKYIKKE